MDGTEELWYKACRVAGGVLKDVKVICYYGSELRCRICGCFKEWEMEWGMVGTNSSLSIFLNLNISFLVFLVCFPELLPYFCMPKHEEYLKMACCFFYLDSVRVVQPNLKPIHCIAKPQEELHKMTPETSLITRVKSKVWRSFIFLGCTVRWLIEHNIRTHTCKANTIHQLWTVHWSDQQS